MVPIHTWVSWEDGFTGQHLKFIYIILCVSKCNPFRLLCGVYDFFAIACVHTVEDMYNCRSGLRKSILNTRKTLLWMQICWILLRVRVETTKNGIAEKMPYNSETQLLRNTFISIG